VGVWPTADDWLAGGKRIWLPRLGYEVFVRLDGPVGAPLLTLLHGFPSSSHDWALVLPGLAEQHRVLSLDFLGLGDSDKPREFAYQLFQQADVVQQVWDELGFAAGGALVAHDYGVSVAQELLARAVPFERVAWLNGGIYPDLHRPIPMQVALAGPGGPQVAETATPGLVVDTLRSVLSRPVDPRIVANLAASAARRDGLRNFHLILTYMEQRRQNQQRWVTAFENARIPYAFIWGLEDPISGGHMLDRIQQRLPHAAITPLADVGHYPELEAPHRTMNALTTFLNQPEQSNVVI
jgi:pimeloyl-ACP methyl ester carboxylesterase